MKILLTGSTGYVGKLITLGLGRQWEITGVSRKAVTDKKKFGFDLTDATLVKQLSELISPDVIVHAAGDKNLARCEENPVEAYQANVQTTLNLAKNFPKIRTVYISSDYVFSGDRGGYREDDAIGATTVYGRTKACAELTGLALNPQFCVLRLSALYDQNATFFRYIKETLARGELVSCYEDAFYSPTYFGHFLTVLQQIVESPKLDRRIYHASGQRISRYFFAKLYARAANLDSSLIRPGSRIVERAPFIFTDISLENTITCESLDVSVGRHQEYLALLGLTP